MRAHLLTGLGGDFVHAADLPPFNVPPTVLLWGTRVFAFHEMKEGIAYYGEAFTFTLPVSTLNPPTKAKGHALAPCTCSTSRLEIVERKVDRQRGFLVRCTSCTRRTREHPQEKAAIAEWNDWTRKARHEGGFFDVFAGLAALYLIGVALAFACAPWFVAWVYALPLLAIASVLAFDIVGVVAQRVRARRATGRARR